MQIIHLDTSHTLLCNTFIYNKPATHTRAYYVKIPCMALMNNSEDQVYLWVLTLVKDQFKLLDYIPTNTKQTLIPTFIFNLIFQCGPFVAFCQCGRFVGGPYVDGRFVRVPYVGRPFVGGPFVGGPFVADSFDWCIFVIY